MKNTAPVLSLRHNSRSPHMNTVGPQDVLKSPSKVWSSYIIIAPHGVHGRSPVMTASLVSLAATLTIVFSSVSVSYLDFGTSTEFSRKFS